MYPTNEKTTENGIVSPSPIRMLYLLLYSDKNQDIEIKYGFTVVKNAPLLHRNKFNESRYKGIALRCCQREHDAKHKLYLNSINKQ